MRQVLNLYVVISFLVITAYPSLLTTKIIEHIKYEKICTHNGTKLLLSNGKIIDEEEYGNACEICIACFADIILDLYNSNCLNKKLLSNINFNFYILFSLIDLSFKKIRAPPIN